MFNWGRFLIIPIIRMMGKTVPCSHLRSPARIVKIMHSVHSLHVEYTYNWHLQTMTVTRSFTCSKYFYNSNHKTSNNAVIIKSLKFKQWKHHKV